jgi:hypothetical protein
MRLPLKAKGRKNKFVTNNISTDQKKYKKWNERN